MIDCSGNEPRHIRDLTQWNGEIFASVCELFITLLHERCLNAVPQAHKTNNAPE